MAHLQHSAVREDDSSIKSSPHHVADQERKLSRSPHPYHRRGMSLLNAQDQDEEHRQPSDKGNELLCGISSSESGTEADDERGRFLKGLPAPLLRSHKGLRDTPFEDSTAQPSPSASPPLIGSNDQQPVSQVRAKHGTWILDEGAAEQTTREKYTKRKRSEVVRRTTETLLFFAVGLVASFDHLSENVLLAYGSGESGYMHSFVLHLTSYSNRLSICCCYFSLPVVPPPRSISGNASWS